MEVSRKKDWLQDILLLLCDLGAEGGQKVHVPRVFFSCVPCVLLCLPLVHLAFTTLSLLPQRYFNGRAYLLA